MQCLDLLLGGALQAVQLVVQLPQLTDEGIHGWLRAHLADLEIRVHVELHPLLAGETPWDLVPHGRSVAPSLGQDGIALLWMVLQEGCEVVDLPAYGHPAVVGLVVPSHLRQGDVAAGEAQGHPVLVRVVLWAGARPC